MATEDGCAFEALLQDVIALQAERDALPADHARRVTLEDRIDRLSTRLDAMLTNASDAYLVDIRREKAWLPSFVSDEAYADLLPHDVQPRAA